MTHALCSSFGRGNVAQRVFPRPSCQCWQARRDPGGGGILAWPGELSPALATTHLADR
ncbi:hypothetical protein Y600_6068 [Burkholderia pseudomallei MSHR3709]|nr:hypothetical protein Y600_6068 [Burkholderia pseudomallei MSHR3709]